MAVAGSAGCKLLGGADTTSSATVTNSTKKKSSFSALALTEERVINICQHFKQGLRKRISKPDPLPNILEHQESVLYLSKGEFLIHLISHN